MIAVPALLLAMLLGMQAQALAQVYVGGVQSPIAGPWNSGSGPVGVASDSAGNIYVGTYPDTGIYEVNATTRAVSTYIAPGTSICGEVPSESQLIAIDPSNNLYITDGEHNRIDEWSLTTNSCVAEYPVTAPFSVLIDAAGNLWYGTWSGDVGTVGKIPKGSPSGTAGTTVIGTGLTGVTGMVFDSAGNLYVSDHNTSKVFEYTAASGYAVSSQTTVIASANTPYSLYFDASGNLDVSESSFNSVVKYFAPGFTSDVQLAPAIVGAEGFGTDKFGNLYLTAYLGNTVTEISLQGFGFGQQNVGVTSSPVAVNFSIAEGTTIGSFQAVEQGNTGQEFAVQSPNTSGTPCATGAYAETETCSVNVVFTPRYPGLRVGAVEALDSSGNILATANISGTGVAPEVAFTPGTINTVAGNGTQGYGGNSGAATSAELDQPAGLAVDSANNFYFADFDNNRIRKVTAGQISTVAGNGTAAYSGDGGLATGAELSSPAGVAVDGAGNLYIADTGNNVIREVNAGTGYISTVAGNGAACASPTSTTSPCGDGGAATSAELNGPVGVAVDSAGNIYIADENDNRIREVTAATGKISTVVGTGTAAYNGDEIPATSAEVSNPEGVSVDSAGDLFIADTGNDRIREVIAATGTIFTEAGNGTPGYSGDGGMSTEAELNIPTGVEVDSAGDVYIADAENDRIRVVSGVTGIINTVAGNGTAGYNSDGIASTSAELKTPTSVMLDGAGDLYIADTSNNRIREVNVGMVPALSFATPTIVGQTDATDGAQTLTVSNTGNAPLTFTAPSQGGSNPSYPANFPENSGAANLCSSSSSLATGVSCNVSMDFEPTGGGTNAGTVMLTDNALNVETADVGSAQQSVSLSGTGQEPDATTVAVSAAPPAVINGQSVTLLATVTDLTNSGTAPTGSVTFTDTVNTTATTLGTVSLANGVAAFPDYNPTVGTHHVTISYTPTPAFASGNSTTSFTVAAYGTLARFQVALANSPVYAGVGDPLTVTALDQFGNVITSFSGSMTFSSTDSGAVLSTPLSFSNGVGTGVVSFATAGTQTVTFSASGLSGTSNAVTVQATPQYMVTVATDTTTGVASDCTNQNLSGATPDANCSLRDAITAANAIQFAPGVTASTHITFEPSVFGTAQTITLANGVLPLASNLSIAGPTTGGGVTQTNLLTVSGNQTSGVFSVGAGVTVALSQLVITKGATSGNVGGAGIYNAGNLTVNLSTISGNQASATSGTTGGGGIVNTGTLTLSNSTVSGNSVTSAGEAGGGGISNFGTLTVSNSTIASNSASVTAGTNAGGGGIYNAAGTLVISNSTLSANNAIIGGGLGIAGGTLTAINNIVAGNTAAEGPDCYAVDGSSCTVLSTGNLTGSGSELQTLANNGGPTQTMMPQLGSPALGAGTYQTGEPAMDQRGYARPSSGAIDLGSIQVSGSGAAVTAISPVAGPLAGGTTVTITGTGFTGATEVYFGDVAASSFTVNSATNITARAPAESAGTVNIEVVTPAGLSGTVAADKYTYSSVAAMLNDASVSLTESHAVTALVPVSGTGGTAPLVYSLSPALPAGLSYSSSTGAITGTPTATSPLTIYTATVTDANGATSTAQFTLTVSAAVAATLNDASVSLTESHAVTALVPVSGTGGTAPLTYSLSPALPAGLSYSSSTGTITGTPTATNPVTTYTVIVTDANGETATVQFALTVNAAVVAKQNTASPSLTENQPATSFTPVSSSGGTAPLTYSLSPATLPAGLTFSPSTGTISGTPTAGSPATTYTVTVTDANGATTSASFSLTVNSAVTATQSAAPTTLTYGQSTTFKPVNGAGGTGTLTYTIAPALPAGLTYSQSTGTITGVATAVTAPTTYTVTVTDTNGATTTATFSLAVHQATVSGVLLTSTVNPVLAGSTTTLVATVSSPVSTPTGTVSFIDASSSTPLGSAALSGGVAQLPVSNLAVGTHSITAVYSGDTDFAGATSAAWSEQVGDFGLSIASTSPSATISPGGTANYGLTLAPIGTTSFVAAVALSVTGLPPGATYTLTPNSIAAGAGTTNLQLSVSLPSQTAALQHGEPTRGGLVSVALGLLLLPFSRRMRRSASRFGRMAAVLLLLIAGAAGVAGLTGCGASTGFFGQAQQTYNVSVVATSGTLTHSTIVTLTVK